LQKLLRNSLFHIQKCIHFRHPKPFNCFYCIGFRQVHSEWPRMAPQTPMHIRYVHVREHFSLALLAKGKKGKKSLQHASRSISCISCISCTSRTYHPGRCCRENAGTRRSNMLNDPLLSRNREGQVIILKFVHCIWYPPRFHLKSLTLRYFKPPLSQAGPCKKREREREMFQGSKSP
jgi:hypothetical protein